MPFKRLVKLTFKAEKVDDFITIFNESSSLIRNFPGCQHLELWRSKQEPSVLFTFSLWENEEALEVYRHSKLFETTWAKTKVLFVGKPEAWSMEVLAKI